MRNLPYCAAMESTYMINEVLVKHFEEMIADNAVLYTTDTDRDELWNIYIDSFTPADNPIYRVRSTHDCSACRQFIKAIGNVVTIKDGKVISIWDFESPEPEYIAPIAAMSAYVKSKVCTPTDCICTGRLARRCVDSSRRTTNCS